MYFNIISSKFLNCDFVNPFFEYYHAYLFILAKKLLKLQIMNYYKMEHINLMFIRVFINHPKILLLKIYIHLKYFSLTSNQ